MLWCCWVETCRSFSRTLLPGARRVGRDGSSTPVAPAAVRGLGWVQMDALDELGAVHDPWYWSRQGRGRGQTGLFGWGWWSWTHTVAGLRHFGLPGPRPHFHRCPVVVGGRLAVGLLQPQVVTTRGRGSVAISTMPP